MAGKKGQKKRFWSDEEKVSICALHLRKSILRWESLRSHNWAQMQIVENFSGTSNVSFNPLDNDLWIFRN